MVWALKALRYPWLWAISCFAVGIILSLWVSDYVQSVNANKVKALVIKETDRIADVANQRVQVYDNGLYAVRTHVLSSKFQLSSSEFHSFVESLNLSIKFPGARGFGIVVRVPLEEEPSFVAKARLDGPSYFAIRQFKANALDRYVIQYVEPMDNNKAAVGLDIGSEAARREAAEQSIESGQIRITAPITLAQVPNKPQQSFLLLLPIYRSWETPSTPDARHAQTKAWAYAPLLMSEILAGVGFDKENFSVQFQDIDTKDRQVFYQSETNVGHLLYTQERVLPVYGRHWMITVSASEHYVISLGLMTRTATLMISLFISLIVSVLVGVIVFNRRQGSQMATQAAVINAVLNGANDAIISTDFNGKITGWNKGAQVHFGYADNEVLGQSIVDLLVPENSKADALATIQKAKSLEHTKPYTAKRKHKSGALIDVLVALTPLLDKRKQVMGMCVTFSNISELKNIERDLIALTLSLEQRVQERTQEANNTKRNLEILLNAVPISISQWTCYQTHVISNAASHKRLGVSADDIKNFPLGKFWNKKIVPQFDLLLEGVLSGYPQTTEYKIQNKESEHSYLLHLVPDIEGAAVVGLYVIELDITDLAQSQFRLLEAKRETQSLLDAINQQFPYSVTDRSGKIIEVNDQFCLITGYSREALLGKTHQLINAGYHSREFWDEVWKWISAGKTWRGEICNRTQAGDIIWLDSVISPVFDSYGRLTRYIALRSDITARKKAEAAREELSRYLQDVMSATSQVAIIATDLKGTITLFNRGAENLLGYRAEELVGKSSSIVIHKLDEIMARGTELSAEAGTVIEGFQVFAHKLTQGETETRRWTYVRKDGTEFMVSLSTALIVNMHNYPVGYVGIATDISHQYELEKNLRLAKEIADQASQAKSQFLANMSHEIRTPMNAVLGMLQLMGHTALNVQQEDYVQKAHSAAKSLLEILNDILDFSKIDAGKLQLDPVEFDLEELLRELSVVLSGNHKNKTLEVLFELDPRLPSHFVGDRLRLQQVLVNLASNALKFTAEGFVKIRLSLKSISNKMAEINFSVEDSGIGISPEQQLKLFQSFSQAEASTTRRFGGTGLGLVISKRLVELMGAELCVDSKVGVGSRFYFDVTLPIADQTLLNSHKFIEAKPIRILVVDDSPLQRESLSIGLRSFGWQVETAADGKTALEKISQAQAAEQNYQLIVLDWYMPQMDGLATARALRNSLQNHTPIIVMPTGFERQTVSELGALDAVLFADSVVKPATPKQIAEAIWQTLFGRFPKQAVANEKPLQGLQLLVVEDNELNRQVALELLENVGATVTLAEGGLEGVYKVTQEPHQYDLVIMDLQMPDIDGLEATRRIRQDARFNHLPILAMTANVTPQDRQACLDAGMNDHIGKPINMEHVVPSILMLTGRMQAAPMHLSVDTEPPLVLLENHEQVLGRFGGNHSLFEKMLVKFAPEIQALMDKYRRAQAAGDLPLGVIAMHSIKGVAATMGAQALSKTAARLEKQGKAGQWALPQELSEMESLVTQTINAFNETLTPATVSVATAGSTASAGDLLVQLIEQLRNNNMAALFTAEQLAQTAPTSARIKELNGVIQNLEFDRALLLAQSLSHETH